MLHVDRENLRAAMEWALASGNRVAALHLGIFLFTYWSWAADPEDTVGEWYRRALWLPGEQRDRSEGLAMAWLAWYSFDPAPLEAALALAEDLDDDTVRCTVHWCWSSLVGSTDLAAARRHVDLALATGRAGGFGLGVIVSLDRAAWIAMAEGDLPGAIACAREAVASVSASDYFRVFRYHMATSLATILALAGEHAEAERVAVQVVAATAATLLPGLRAVVLVRAATAAVLGKRPGAAWSLLREALALLRQIGSRRWVADALHLVVLFAADQGRTDEAAELLAAADRYVGHHNETPGSTFPVIAEALAVVRVASRTVDERPTLDEVLAAAVDVLGPRP